MKKTALKFFSVLMALVFTLSFTVVSFADDTGFLGTFTVEGGEASILVYDTQDDVTDGNGVEASSAYARDSDSGEILTDGSGQINFTVVPADGYEVSDVTVTGTYKNLKGPADTGAANTYRITKVQSDLTITVALAASQEEEEETGDTVITFSGTSVSVSGSKSGVTVDGAAVTITASGDYTITGTGSDGYVEVAKGLTDVNLILDNLILTSSTYAPISCKGSTEVTITAKDGTVNTLTDADRSEEKPKSCVNSGGDLTLTGTGTLTVNGNNKNGIKADGSLTIDTLTLNVNSKDNCLAADSVLTINSGVITAASTAGDCIKSAPDNDEDAEELAYGTIVINGGTITLNAAAGDGIQAGNGDDNLSYLTINGGTFSITTNGGAATKISDSDDGSYKGVKSDNSLVIAGGTFTINSADDAVHSNGDITIKNGSFSIKTGDDGIHADETVTIENGTINILTCYEGIEGYDIIINDGDIDVISSDDGINISGGNDSSGTANPGFSDDSGMGGSRPGSQGGISIPGMGGQGGQGGQPGGQGGAASGTAGTLTINGGDIEVNASGDGLDANGSIVMNGGNVLVYGPLSDGDSAIDYDGSFTINGGTILAIGQSGMAQAPTSSSQGVVSFTLSRSQSAGAITIEDSDGNVLAEASPSRSFNSVIFSSPEVESDGSYSLLSGSDVIATAGSTEENLSIFARIIRFLKNLFANIVTFVKSIFNF